MLDKVSKTLVKVFGSRNERLVKAYSVIGQQAGEFEEQVKKLDDEALKAKTLAVMGESHKMVVGFHYAVLNQGPGICAG